MPLFLRWIKIFSRRGRAVLTSYTRWSGCEEVDPPSDVAGDVSSLWEVVAVCNLPRLRRLQPALQLTMMEQSTDVDRFRCQPIGRHKRTRACRVLASVAINDTTLHASCTAANTASVIVSYEKFPSSLPTTTDTVIIPTTLVAQVEQSARCVCVCVSTNLPLI